jgi:hypothetical protein
MLTLVNEAIESAGNPNITVMECLAGNSDPTTMQGDPVQACFLNYGGLGVPVDRSISDFKRNAEGQLTFVGKMQSTINNFGPVSHTHVA